MDRPTIKYRELLNMEALRGLKEWRVGKRLFVDCRWNEDGREWFEECLRRGIRVVDRRESDLLYVIPLLARF